MDLSSLEGPPIDDPRVVSTPDSTIPRIREEPATSNSTPHNMLWKPLPPRPASAEPMSSRQQQQRRPGARPTGHHGADLPGSDPHLRRVPAQRGRRSPTDDDDDDEFMPGSVFPEERPRSPHHPTHLEPERRLMRSRSSDPLVWLEDEEQWVVAGPSTRRSSAQIRQLPPRLRNATTRPLGRYPDMSDDSDDDLERSDHPPDYESHQFSPTHVMRLTYGPASRPRASARRTHNLST